MSVTIYPCDTTGRPVPGALTANWANGNARPLLASVGLDAGEYLCGQIGPDEVEAISTECTRALGSDATGLVSRAPMLRAAASHGNVIMCGSDDESAQRRLRELRAVLQYAADRGLGVTWS